MTRRDIDTKSGTISSDSLCTPPEIADPLYELWDGPADTDPCSNEHSIIAAERIYTFGGLHLPWIDKTYANWPYSTNEPWVDKGVAEMKVLRVSELVVLCMTATSTRWWSKLMTLPRRNPRVINTKRLKFLGPGGRPLKNGARFDTSLIYYGPKANKFDRLFSRVTMWSTWGR